ncbi:hypothetical protein PG993_004011 [Apiospora rasikravindrae]|uniref:Uncharacterized protein n=1 Tax=Apiospora rasikravindrae TaxID=990691 RepID=A0ABR1TC39_9PEZI
MAADEKAGGRPSTPPEPTAAKEPVTAILPDTQKQILSIQLDFRCAVGEMTTDPCDVTFVTDSARKVPLQIGGATTVAEPSETAPLLQGSQPSEIPTSPIGSESDANPGGWTKDAARTAILSTVFLILYAFADVARYVAVVRLLELGICREEYLSRGSDILGDGGFIPEHLCKSPNIQQRLARLRGYLSSLEAIVGLLLTLPYGLVVDDLGERFIAGVNVGGYMLSCAWLAIVCYYWTVFPVWVAVLSPLFRVIGGGTPTYTSVVCSMASKRVPAESRSIEHQFN